MPLRVHNLRTYHQHAAPPATVRNQTAMSDDTAKEQELELPGAGRALPPGFDDAFQRLVATSASSIDPCLAAKVIALAAPAVRQLITTRHAEGVRLREVRCDSSGRVLLAFDDPAVPYRFVEDGSVLIDVDLETRTVRGVTDGSEVVPHQRNVVPPSFFAPWEADVGETPAPVDGVDESDLAAGRRKLRAARVDLHREQTATAIELKLLGGLRRATASVEGMPIELRAVAGGAGGRGRVVLTPAHVDVDLDITTGPWVTVTVVLALNGKESKKQVYSRGGQSTHRVQFGFTEFGLPTGRIA